jgi:phytanoyl-CoA hydroxylase
MSRLLKYNMVERTLLVRAFNWTFGKIISGILANDRLFPKRRKSLDERNRALRSSKDHSIEGLWPASPELMPWFDQPDALGHINSMNKNSGDKKLLRKWVNDGYIVQNILSDSECDALVDEMVNGVWGGRSRYPELEFIGVQTSEQNQTSTISQKEMKSYSKKEQSWMMLNNNWRIHGLMDMSKLFGKVAENKEIIRIASMLFDETAEVGFSLNFGNGSEQTLHQDIAQFNIYPRNFLIGVWIALEDIHIDSGPLIYHPGSHKLGMWEKHSANYPQTMLGTMSSEENRKYFKWLAEKSNEISPRKTFLAKKGQVFFWHPCLAHGGSKRNDRTLSRHSYVFHMLPRNKDVDKRLIVNK